MTSEAVGEMESKSVEAVLEIMEEKYPELRGVQGLKEHLMKLKIQFQV